MSPNIIQIAYKEGVFQFDNNAYELGKTLNVGINPIMKIDKEAENLLTLQITVDYQCEGKPIMKYGGLAMYKVDGLGKLLINKDFKINMWTEATMFFRGIICEKLRGSAIERFFLPNIPADKIQDIPLQGMN